MYIDFFFNEDSKDIIKNRVGMFGPETNFYQNPQLFIFILFFIVVNISLRELCTVYRYFFFFYEDSKDIIKKSRIGVQTGNGLLPTDVLQ